MRSYYEVLEVDETATDTEIKQAYRKLAMKYHPDKNPEGAELFKEVSHAYETLSDPDRRAAYDQFGFAESSGGGPSHMHSDFNMDDLYGEFFGQGGFFTQDGHPHQSRPTRAERLPLKVSLEDLFTGKKRRIKLERSIPCASCKGLGGKKSVLRKCVVCDGNGHRTALRQVGPGMMMNQEVPCQTCQGKGRVIPDKYRCKKCKGACVQSKQDKVVVKIEPGMRDGQTIVLNGMGDQEPGKEPQDLVFELKQTDHPTLKRTGDHLTCTAEIDLAEALCGFSRVLFTDLDGGRPTVVSHKSGVLKPGDVLCVRDKGMPKENRPRDRGDLFIKLTIKFPDSKNWVPDPALKEMLSPSKRSRNTAAESNDEVETVTAGSLSTEEYLERTKASKNAYDTSQDPHEFEGYNDAYYDQFNSTFSGGPGVAECQQQ